MVLIFLFTHWEYCTIADVAVFAEQVSTVKFNQAGG
jgi:hypothetical protein